MITTVREDDGVESYYYYHKNPNGTNGSIVESSTNKIKPNQVHHFATNKSKTYTSQFENDQMKTKIINTPEMLYKNYWIKK